MGLALLGDVGGAAHVLVGGIRAAADQGGRDVIAELVAGVGDLGGQAADRPRAIRSVGTDDVGLERREIEADDPIVEVLGVALDLHVGRDQVAVLFGQR